MLDFYYAGLSDISRYAYAEGLVGDDLGPLADGDGVSNLVEYVLGSSLSTSHKPITTKYSDGLLALNFTDMNRLGFTVILTRALFRQRIVLALPQNKTQPSTGC